MVEKTNITELCYPHTVSTVKRGSTAGSSHTAMRSLEIPSSGSSAGIEESKLDITSVYTLSTPLYKSPFSENSTSAGLANTAEFVSNNRSGRLTPICTISIDSFLT